MILEWFETHRSVNNEKTIFMICEGGSDDFFMHGRFVHNMTNVPTSQELKVVFITLYIKDFDITRGDVMKTFMRMLHHFKVTLDMYKNSI